MSMGKRLSGFCLIGLGAIGMAVGLAGIMALWIGAARLRQINSRLFRQVDQLIVQVDQRTTKAREAVVETRDLVNALKQKLQATAKDLLAERVASLPEVENIEGRLVVAMERSDELLTISASAVELMDQLLATIGVIQSEGSADQQNSSDLMATIRSTRESLTSASEVLTDVQRRLAEIREKRGVEVNLSEITKLSLGMVSKLDVVQTQLAEFRSRLNEVKNRTTQLQDKIKNWILASQCLILLLIVWMSAGQFCLLHYGRRLLRSPAAPASNPTR